MKRINKALTAPNSLTEFLHLHPLSGWKDFRADSKRGRSKKLGKERYNAVKTQIKKDQRGLCAYCEIDLLTKADPTDSGFDDFRVEHFIPKSLPSPPNYALDWSNMLGVCHGGSQSSVCDPARYSNKQEDRSCDVPKADHDWTGDILNPLNIPSSPRLFKFDESTGDIMVDAMTCPSALQHRASETIRLLRLSAPRLNNLRLPVFEMLNEKMQELATQGLETEEAANLLAEELIPEKSEMHLPAFFTSIRWYLGEAQGDRI